jgi:tetratricopeptide (TPR) repeat protein
MVLASKGDLAGAKAQFAHALAIGEEASGPESIWAARCQKLLAFAMLGLGEAAEARACYERALAVEEKVFGPGHGYLFGTRQDFARLLQDLGEPEPARVLLERTLTMMKGQQPETSVEIFVLLVLHPLGSVLLDLGDLEGAERRLERALSIAPRYRDDGDFGHWAGPDYEGAVAMLPTLGRLRLSRGGWRRRRPPSRSPSPLPSTSALPTGGGRPLPTWSMASPSRHWAISLEPESIWSRPLPCLSARSAHSTRGRSAPDAAWPRSTRRPRSLTWRIPLRPGQR